MRWQPSHTRTLLILTALAIASATATHFIRHQPDTHLIVPIANEDQTYDSYTTVKLAFKEFRPATNDFAGSFDIEISPNWDHIKPEDRKAWASQFTKGFLRFNHWKNDHNTMDYQGGADTEFPVAFPPMWGSLQGKGNFSWNGIPQPGPFYYPFDRYVLHVNPELVQLSDSGIYPVHPINHLETDFSNSNFVPERRQLAVAARDYQSDRYEITLQRPALLRTLTIVVAALLLIWLAYLVWAAKPGENAGQIVTLFVGVFSIRSSLLSGAPVFPSLIDYCALAVYLSAALIVLIKWLVPDQNTQTCPHCKSTINNQATICPECTRPIHEPLPTSVM